MDKQADVLRRGTSDHEEENTQGAFCRGREPRFPLRGAAEEQHWLNPALLFHMLEKSVEGKKRGGGGQGDSHEAQL